MSDSIARNEVTYLPRTAFDEIRDGIDPIATYSRQLAPGGWSFDPFTNVWRNEDGPVDLGSPGLLDVLPYMPMFQDERQVTINVFNALLDDRIEARNMYLKHSDVVSMPAVTDLKGTPRRQPSQIAAAKAGKGGNQRTDWIDATGNSMMCSTGFWSAKRPSLGSFYGWDIGVTLDIPTLATTIQLSIMRPKSRVARPSYSKETWFTGWVGEPSSARTDEDFYDYCDDGRDSGTTTVVVNTDGSDPNAQVLTHGDLKVSLRCSPAGGQSATLFACVESTKATS